jgi:hypothetical protein
MPGAADTNAALDASSTPQVWAPGASAPASNIHILVGSGSYTYQTFLINRGTAIANLVLEFTTSGPLVLGSIYGHSQLPAIRLLGNVQTTVPLTCSVTTSARYRCEVASFPAGSSAPWQVMMPFFATGGAAAQGGVTLHTFGATATDQFAAMPLSIDFDSANTADRVVSPLTFTSAVVPGTDYTKAQFATLTGHVVRASFTNKGPATLNPPFQIGVTVQSPAGAAGEWRIDPGSSLPAGCTNDTPLGAFLFFRCSGSSPLGANQTLTFDLPVKLSGGRKLTPPPPQSFSAWPPCGAACIPKGLEVAVSILSHGTPPLDPDRSNDFSPRLVGPNGEFLQAPRQAVTICPTSWTVSEQTQSGEFGKLRCGP